MVRRWTVISIFRRSCAGLVHSKQLDTLGTHGTGVLLYIVLTLIVLHASCSAWHWYQPYLELVEHNLNKAVFLLLLSHQPLLPLFELFLLRLHHRHLAVGRLHRLPTKSDDRHEMNHQTAAKNALPVYLYHLLLTTIHTLVLRAVHDLNILAKFRKVHS